MYVLWDAPGTGSTATEAASGIDRTYPDVATQTGPFILGTRGSTGNRLSAIQQASGMQAAYVEPVIIDLGRQGARDGAYEITLRFNHLLENGVVTPIGPSHGTLTVDVGYVHLERWTRLSSPSSCSW